MGKTITAMNLRKTNIYAGILHLVQMAAVLALSNDFALPVTATYMSGPPGSSFAPPVVLFTTPVGLTVAIFLGLSALAHFIVASPQFSRVIALVLRHNEITSDGLNTRLAHQ